MRSTSQIVFACYSKACAPPPAGSGGSKPGVSGGAVSNVSAVRREKIGELARGSTQVHQFGGSNGESLEARVMPKGDGFHVSLTERGKGTPGGGSLGRHLSSKTLLDVTTKSREAGAAAISLYIDGHAKWSTDTYHAEAALSSAGNSSFPHTNFTITKASRVTKNSRLRYGSGGDSNRGMAAKKAIEAVDTVKPIRMSLTKPKPGLSAP